MAYLATAPGVSFGFVDGRAVFLDIRGDRYAALPPDLTDMLTTVVAHNGAAEKAHPRIARLVATGLFEFGPDPNAIAHVAHSPPAKGLDNDPRQRFNLADLVEVWWLVARAARSVRNRPLDQMLAPPRKPNTALDNPGRQTRLENLSRRFLGMRTFVPVAPACLADSLALRAWLARRGLDCRLVMAVRIDPFEAHCWIEAGGVVLNDAPERIATFMPVAVAP